MQKCLQNLWVASLKKMYYTIIVMKHWFIYTWMEINKMFAFEN